MPEIQDGGRKQFNSPEYLTFYFHPFFNKQFTNDQLQHYSYIQGGLKKETRRIGYNFFTNCNTTMKLYQIKTYTIPF